MNSNDNISITFHVNGKPVEQEIKRLDKQAAELRTKMDAAFTAGDTKQYKKLEKQLKQVEKQTERVVGQHRRLNQTLNNLSTAKPNSHELNVVNNDTAHLLIQLFHQFGSSHLQFCP